jgi:hypothetical protein
MLIGNTNLKFLLLKFFTVSTCGLVAWEQLVAYNNITLVANGLEATQHRGRILGNRTSRLRGDMFKLQPWKQLQVCSQAVVLFTLSYKM